MGFLGKNSVFFRKTIDKLNRYDIVIIAVYRRLKNGGTFASVHAGKSGKKANRLCHDRDLPRSSPARGIGPGTRANRPAVIPPKTNGDLPLRLETSLLRGAV